MKKFFIVLLLLLSTLTALPACARDIDYYDYVSQTRDNIYIYEDDAVQLKIYCGSREAPFNGDGITGEVSPFCEIYLRLSAQNESVNIYLENISGEMSYSAVKGCYYLSSGNAISKQSSLKTKVVIGKNEQEYVATSVIYDGIIDSKKALDCVVEYKSELFKEMTQNNIFMGEIHIRLIYDDACYYFVGICDRTGKTIACLVDGATGKIIAERTVG